MRATSLTLCAALLLSACSGVPRPASHPTAARLGGEQLRVTMSDGRICHASVPLTGGAGRFADCPEAGDWQVTIHKRNLLEPIFGAAVSPYGRIAITAPSGRVWVFRTPPQRQRRR